MATIEDGIAYVKEAVSVAGQKTSEVYEIQKTRLQIVDIKTKIASEYKKLGELYYASAKDGADRGESIHGIIATIDSYRGEIAGLELKLSQLRRERVCPKCGAKNTLDAVYCNTCGEKLVYTSVTADAPTDEE